MGHVTTTLEPSGTGDLARLHENGLTFARARRFAEAAEVFRRVTEAEELNVDAARHLAMALADAGKLDESRRAWERFIALVPDKPEALRQLSTICKRLGQFDDAADAFRKAIELEGPSAGAQVDLGVLLIQAKRHADAKAAFIRALELDADFFDAHLNLGMLLQEMKDGEGSLKHLRRAIELRPTDPSGHNNLGVALSEQGHFGEAIECYKKLLTFAPEYYLAWNNLGNALRSLGRLDDAIVALNKALELKPDYTEAYNNLGIIYAQVEKFADAIRSYDKALLLRPDYPEAHANRGLVYLLLGNFQQGWADYEWRWHGPHGLKRRTFSARPWDGSPLSGKRILLYYEQGLGDTFQFIRYAKELKARGATVIFECQGNTKHILSRTPGIDEMVIRGDKPPVCDFYAPLLSLPGLCQTNLDNLPRKVPYVFTDPSLIWDLKRRLDAHPGYRVGIVWQGNPEHKGDRNRSIPLRQFAPLAAVPGVRLISLQKNFGTEQIESLNELFELSRLDGIAETDDGWLRTAAILANLDLVVTADTSVAHLAGAMGIPVWVAIPTSPDWRWLLGRDDTPWYPTMRLFRQRRLGDWEELFARMGEALRERVTQSSRNANNPATDVDQALAKDLSQKAGTHLRQNELPAAVALLEKAAGLDPTSADVQQDLGVAYAKQGRLSQAIVCFRRALELAPESAGSYANLGLACLHLGAIEEAVSHLRKAVWLGAGSADTHKNLARSLAALPDPAGAEAAYYAALRLQPDDIDAHYHLSRVLLAQGKFEQEWLEYEWRWKWTKAARREFARPRWSGQPLEGKRLLVSAEDDTRETLQLVRYADLLARQGAKVVIEVPAELKRLLAGCVGVERTIARGDKLPSFDFHVSLSSLPAVFGTTFDTLPAARPYLGVANDALERHGKVLERSGGIRVGIALGLDGPRRLVLGGTNFLTTMIDRLVDIPNVSLVILHGFESGHTFDGSKAASILNLTSELATADLSESAASVRSLDLLITADNTLAHVAGATGSPAWVLLELFADPVWLQDQDRTPWYPTLRLFRQRRRHDRDDLMDRVVHGVERLARAPRRPRE